MNEWKTLISKLNVSGESNSFCDKESLELFEAETEIILPADYKEYCQVFGSGVLGNFIRIYCPCTIGSRAHLLQFGSSNLASLKDSVSFEKETVEAGNPGVDLTEIEFLERLLNNSFPFGDTPNADVFLWDLNTYQSIDDSYDIYRVSFDDLQHTFLVGRKFSEFVRDFCLGTKSNEILPEEFHFYEREGIDNSFYRLVEEKANQKPKI